MVSDRVHPPDNVVQSQGHPREGDVMPHQERREHPPELRGAEAAVIRVVDKILVVVPVEETTFQGRHEHDEAHQGEDRGDGQVRYPPPGCRDGGDRRSWARPGAQGGTPHGNRRYRRRRSADEMKRLAPHSTWWPKLPHRVNMRSPSQKERASHGPCWHRRP